MERDTETMSTAEQKARAAMETLTDGLIDPVSLSQVNWHVKEQNPSLPLPEWQDETLEMVRSLLSDGLMRIGSRGEEDRFEGWDVTVEDAIRQIRDVLVTRYDERRWPYYCWFNLTEKGRQLALSTEQGRTIDQREAERRAAVREQDR
jgi:hypothetical protein